MTHLKRLPHSSLPQAGLLLFLGLLILGLTGCYTQLKVADTSRDQQPAFKLDKSLASFKKAVVTSDSDTQLVDLATALLDARAHTQISHSTYRNGVLYFREHHPTFYGNFFGDPFYASYDVRYAQLVHTRQQAELDINPQNSYWNTTSFYCHPLSYDPAFGGICPGIVYAASDYFFLPSLFLQPDPGTRTATFPSLARATPSRPNVQHGGSNMPDTTRQPVVDDRVPRVPESAYASIQETASSLKRTETILRIQQEIKHRAKRRQLSFSERARVARRIAKENGMGDLAQSISREQRIRAQRIDTPIRPDPDETSRRSRQDQINSPANPGSSESARNPSQASDRSRSSERTSSGRERSRARNNSSGS